MKEYELYTNKKNTMYVDMKNTMYVDMKNTIKRGIHREQEEQERQLYIRELYIQKEVYKRYMYIYIFNTLSLPYSL